MTAEEAAGRRLYREGSAPVTRRSRRASGRPAPRCRPACCPAPAATVATGAAGPRGGPPAGDHLAAPDLGPARLRRGEPGPRAGRGLDPAGERLDPAMPRFVMSWRDLANLGAYLKRLEEDRDPGLHEVQLRLGTLLPSAGPLAAAGKTVGALLQAALDELNQAGGIHGRRLELVIADPGPDRASAEAALAGLLEARDVFALLAPLAPALDSRYGELLAPRGVPLIGPLPEAGEEGSRLVFAPLAGLREQLFALAGFAAGESPPGKSPALIAHPPEAARQAEALAARLRAHGWKRVRLFDYGAAQADGEAPLTADLEALFFLGSGRRCSPWAVRWTRPDWRRGCTPAPSR
ncbi:ABC transporter substrate-binding protein [Azotobacter chroococcum]